MGTSLALYLAGITATAKVAFSREPLKNSLIFCFSLSFPVFLVYNLVVGQLATVAVFSLGLAIYLEKRSTLFVSGLALSILTYKPTLLLFIIPMLLVTRRFRAFFGFMAGAATFILASTCFAGVRIWPAYAHFLSTFAGTEGINGVSIVKRWQYVDFNSISYEVPGGRTRLGLAILISTMLCITAWLITLLRQSASGDGAAQKLAWAVTLTWTLLLNVYVPIYDTILIAVAVPLTLSALGDLGWRRISGWVSFLGIGIWAISKSTESFAESHGIQPLTILLLLLGLGQALMLQRAIRLGSLRHSPALVAS
jgi:Glycosyltransferase family 87